MNDREKWRERVRDIRAGITIKFLKIFILFINYLSDLIYIQLIIQKILGYFLTLIYEQIQYQKLIPVRLLRDSKLWTNCCLIILCLLLSSNITIFCPVDWGCRIHWLHLCRLVRSPPLPNVCPGYDTKQSDGEVSVMLELWGMQSTPSLPLHSGPLWPGMVAPDSALFMG